MCHYKMILSHQMAKGMFLHDLRLQIHMLASQVQECCGENNRCALKEAKQVEVRFNLDPK